MPEPQQENPVQGQRAFEVFEVDTVNERVHIAVYRGIVDAIADQLKACPADGEGAGVVRKLGFELATASSILRGSASAEELADFADVIVDGTEADGI